MVKSVWNPAKNIKKQLKTAKKNRQKPCFFVLNCWKYGFASFLFPQKRNMMSEMIVSTNILLITDEKYVETWENSKKRVKSATNSKKPYFLSYILYGFASLFSPQKCNLRSEMIICNNILLINTMKCVGSCRKQQNIRQKPCFFFLIFWKYGIASFFPPQ